MSFWVKRAVSILLLLFVVVLAVSAGGQNDRSELTWSLGLQIIKTNERGEKTTMQVPFAHPIQAEIKERFEILIEPKADCYCYVVQEFNDGEEVGYIYTGPLKNGEYWISPTLSLDPPQGALTLYIVVSREEQTTLAQRISALNNTVSTQRALMNEVFRLRGEISQFREAPEKPVLMGATGRTARSGEEPSVTYSGLITYVKTIIIEY